MQQHTGVPPIIRQHAHPDFMHIIMQSQHAWIMSQHILSPLVQVTQHPFAVISILHAPIVMLQQHTVMPFMVQHMLHIPPAIMVHRFCIITHAAGSSHMHVIFIPPAHFSIFIVQRGTITMFGAMTGMPIPIPVAGDEDGIAAVIGFIIAFTMIVSGSVDWYGPCLWASATILNSCGADAIATTLVGITFLRDHSSRAHCDPGQCDSSQLTLGK